MAVGSERWLQSGSLSGPPALHVWNPNLDSQYCVAPSTTTSNHNHMYNYKKAIYELPSPLRK